MFYQTQSRKVRRKAYVATDRMIDMIRDNYTLLQVLSRFGLSLGFGEQTVQEVCEASKVPTATFLAVANLLNRPEEEDAQHPDYGVASVTHEEMEALQLPVLLGYLRRSHHYFLDFCLPGIRRKLMEAIDCSIQNEVAFLLLKFFDQYMNEVRKHMNYEDSTVFGYVEGLLERLEPDSDATNVSGVPMNVGTQPASGVQPKANVPSASGAQPVAGTALPSFSIRQFATHHDQIDAKLSELKHMLIQYYPASGSNYQLNAVLFDLYSCEQELASHARVEDHLFVPAVFRLEAEVQRLARERAAQGASVAGASDGMAASNGTGVPGTDALTDREKEIIRCVAKGMINKEIAEALFLSVHTVTTHRKNIARKLEIHSVAGLTIYAIAHQLVELSEVKL